MKTIGLQIIPFRQIVEISSRPNTPRGCTHPKLISQVTSAYIRSSSLKPHQHTSDALLSTLINTHPKLISQATSAYIRSSSLKPHQHTSEALLSSHISIHPKLFSQVTSAYIRSSSLKSHKTVTRTPDINQPVNQSTNQANHLFP